MMGKVMVFAPHMDDEVIGCGGSLVKHSERGDLIKVFYFTKGTGFLTDEIRGDMNAEVRDNEALEVIKMLGATCYMAGIRERELRYNVEVLKKVIREIQDYQPDIIYLPHEDETDYEHRLVNQIVTEAIFLAYSTYDCEHSEKINRARIILEYEVWSPIKDVDFVNDIKMQVAKKAELIKKYNSQTEIIKYHEGAVSLNHYRGIMKAHKDSFAEAFKIKCLSREIVENIVYY